MADNSYHRNVEGINVSSTPSSICIMLAACCAMHAISQLRTDTSQRPLNLPRWALSLHDITATSTDIDDTTHEPFKLLTIMSPPTNKGG